MLETASRVEPEEPQEGWKERKLLAMYSIN
jgi:hypothetical protein